MHKVIIPSTGEEFSLPDRSYLTDAEELEVNGLKFGCRKGACGVCAIQIVDGYDNLSSPDKKELAFLGRLGHCQETIRLACKCQLSGSITIQPV
ncbi:MULTISPECIES: 2Fe-2S iron-sulfur cluster-binding protein [Pseudoalteromonas]|uniref:Ferredoxin n=2 Tax=Pseudoalteromonas TaxID=53246 RepID=A0A4Q7ENJ7_9GAMM|nr:MULTISPECIES: 2Fe-2S iron-sulfur cluster-binding protein [Pseudoalteromonas]QTL36859.1 (2Fe-2S)-binding protein [Pseudoalteromonas viridis]RZM85120.1 ferredoxin [Pseudoalteromonas rubra]